MKLLNLNPKVIEKNKHRNSLDRVLITIFISISLIALFICIPVVFLNLKANKTLMTLELEVNQYADLINENEELQQKYEEIKVYTEKIQNLKNNTIKTSEILSELNKNIPSEITFINLSFSENGVISINGKATKYDVVPEFLANLQMSDRFTNSKISSITKIEDTDEWDFSLSIEEVIKDGEVISEKTKE